MLTQYNQKCKLIRIEFIAGYFKKPSIFRFGRTAESAIFVFCANAAQRFPKAHCQAVFQKPSLCFSKTVNCRITALKLCTEIDFII